MHLATIACWTQGLSIGDPDAGSNVGESMNGFWGRMVEKHTPFMALADIETIDIIQSMKKLRPFAVWLPICGNESYIRIGYANPQLCGERQLGWAFIQKSGVFKEHPRAGFHWRKYGYAILEREVGDYSRFLFNRSQKE